MTQSETFTFLKRPKTYKVWLEGQEDYYVFITRFKPGQAKYVFKQSAEKALGAPIEYRNIRARSMRTVLDSVQVNHVASYRNIPAKNGMKCEVNGKLGFIVGAAWDGAWLEVQYYRTSKTMYFHPQADRCKLFDDDGNVIWENQL